MGRKDSFAHAHGKKKERKAILARDCDSPNKQTTILLLVNNNNPKQSSPLGAHSRKPAVPAPCRQDGTPNCAQLEPEPEQPLPLLIGDRKARKPLRLVHLVHRAQPNAVAVTPAHQLPGAPVRTGYCTAYCTW